MICELRDVAERALDQRPRRSWILQGNEVADGLKV